MEDYIYLMATTPGDEPCAQTGDADYLKRARVEARAYVNQLLRIYGTNPSGTHFEIIRCPHDFGTYLDIRFYYDDEDQGHMKYVVDIENGSRNWDSQSRKELAEFGLYRFKVKIPDYSRKGV